MTGSFHRLLPVAAAISLTWGCASDPTGPSGTQPEPSSASVVTYSIRNLGTLGGANSEAYGINDMNVVVGSAQLRSGDSHAFMWKNGVMTDLGTLASGRGSTARAINGSGVIVGSSLNSAGFNRAVRWMNGMKRNLGTLGGKNSDALAISPTGVIVGWAEVASGQRHAFRWENGVMRDLGTLPGGATSIATDINRGGAIVGWSGTASGKNHAFRWKDGVFTDLGDRGREFSQATGINSMGQIVGELGPPPDAVGEERDWVNGFLFHRDVWTVFGGAVTIHVEDISPVSVIVGWDEDLRAETEDQAGKPWVREGATFTPLPKLAPGMAFARAVNRNGVIVGRSPNMGGRGRAVMWRKM